MYRMPKSLEYVERILRSGIVVLKTIPRRWRTLNLVLTHICIFLKDIYKWKRIPDLMTWLSYWTRTITRKFTPLWKEKLISIRFDRTPCNHAIRSAWKICPSGSRIFHVILAIEIFIFNDVITLDVFFRRFNEKVDFSYLCYSRVN